MILARPCTKSMIAVMMGLVIYLPIFMQKQHGQARLRAFSGWPLFSDTNGTYSV